MKNTKSVGYYTVMINFGSDEQKLPYKVFAASDYHAAKIVREKTGYLASEIDVEGPYQLS